jgi:transcriptional regulator with XRE-family HTH domain
MGRSLHTSKTGLAAADKAFKLKGWTQDYLAGAAGCSRQTVSNFFARRPVEKQLFQAICTELGLEWQDIAELDEAEKPDKSLSVDELVQSVRDNLYGSIIEKCGFMRVLDMSQPIGLDDIYTTVNILEKIYRTQKTRDCGAVEASKPGKL